MNVSSYDYFSLLGGLVRIEQLARPFGVTSEFFSEQKGNLHSENLTSMQQLYETVLDQVMLAASSFSATFGELSNSELGRLLARQEFLDNYKGEEEGFISMDELFGLRMRIVDEFASCLSRHSA